MYDDGRSKEMTLTEEENAEKINYDTTLLIRMNLSRGVYYVYT